MASERSVERGGSAHRDQAVAAAGLMSDEEVSRSLLQPSSDEHVYVAAPEQGPTGDEGPKEKHFLVQACGALFTAFPLVASTVLRMFLAPKYAFVGSFLCVATVMIGEYHHSREVKTIDVGLLIVNFLMLPLLCLNNSKFITKKIFVQMLRALGFEVSETKETPKIWFGVLRKTGDSVAENALQKWLTVKTINKDKKFRNTFAVVFS